MKTLDEIHLSDRDRRAVEQAAELLRARFPVEQVALYGSKARGQDDPESDIDLLILTGRTLSASEKKRIIEALFELELELDVVISPLMIPREEWDHGLYQVLPIHREIEREGVVA